LRLNEDAERVIDQARSPVVIRHTMNDGEFKQEGYDFMAAAFEVYNVLGSGMAEEVYQESLEIELELRRIDFCSKPEVIGIYKGRRLQRRYLPDLLVGGAIVAELKSVSALLPEPEAQLFNSLHLTGVRVGYLLNFGRAERSEWRRFLVHPPVRDWCRLAETIAESPERGPSQQPAN
jgi:GxxExxY protein